MSQQTPENGQHPSVYIVAGEVSGDRYAAVLWAELKRLWPQAKAAGVGGSYLRAVGQDQLFDLSVHAVVGITDVLRHYFKFRSFFNQIVEDIQKRKPEALILVDYPGFNLRLAKKIKKITPSLPIIYYISPQVWAWKKRRTRLMKKVIDLLLVIFPFEKDWFEKNEPSLKVEWVGHPLLDRWHGPAHKRTEEGHPLRKITLMPGSREKEIRRHLPLMMETAIRTKAFLPEASFTILAADQTAKKWIYEVLKEEKLNGLHVEVYTGYQLTYLSRSDLVLVASGSATLECCLARAPMLVVYRVHPLTYWIGRSLVKVPYLSMVNILAGEKVVPEFLQENATAEHLTQAIQKIAADTRWLDMMQDRLDRVNASLGGPGASVHAAHAIYQLLKSRAAANTVDARVDK